MNYKFNNQPIKPLKWVRNSNGELTSKSATHDYKIESDGTKFKVKYTPYDVNEGSGDYACGHHTLDCSLEWAENHNCEKLAPWIEQSCIISEMHNWFVKAKPCPDTEALSVQIGCHFEEVHELLEALGMAGETLNIKRIADDFKAKADWCIVLLESLTREQRIAITDAIADGTVTGVGVLYMLGNINVIGSYKEVNRSNWSKFENGEPVFFENGKIAKGENYQAPQLKKFVL